MNIYFMMNTIRATGFTLRPKCTKEERKELYKNVLKILNNLKVENYG
jgi:hypothetical protein